MKNKVQLITYPDSLGGTLASLGALLNGPLQNLFPGGVHILPPFPSSGDRGFAPTTYRQIEPAFGDWGDIRKIGADLDIMLDLMVNHISRNSACFQDFLYFGRASRFADMFLTLEKVWPDGDPPPEDVEKIFLRKPDNPFLDVRIESTGQIERVWASFGPRAEYSEQIDLDVYSPLTRQFFVDLFKFFRNQNVRIIRLDAIGYVIKKPGTSCFMVEPDIYEYIGWLAEEADRFGLIVLPEVHAYYETQLALSKQGFWVYDFVLPMLTLYTLVVGNTTRLLAHLRECPRKQVTMLDCHDGIPVQPDMNGILTVEELRGIVALCLDRGANLNRMMSKNGRSNDFDVHQINITYYDALGQDDDAYLIARAIQFFAPGIPQVYYVGLLAGENDTAGVESSGEGRAINRQNFSTSEVKAAIGKEVVQRLMRLILIRNEHPAFDGDLAVIEGHGEHFVLRWEHGTQFCELVVWLADRRAEIRYTGAGEVVQRFVI